MVLALCIGLWFCLSLGSRLFRRFGRFLQQTPTEPKARRTGQGTYCCSAALALLQQTEAQLGHQVRVSLTLPVMPYGFPTAEMAVVHSAVSAGVQISIVNPMTMDYGSPAPDAGEMGAYAIEAAQAVQQQLATVFPSATAAQLWAIVGITPLIGQNDVSGEVFGLTDADEVAQFAATAGIGRLSLWSVTRDRRCSQGIIAYDSPTCSGVLQGTWAFSHIFEAG